MTDDTRDPQGRIKGVRGEIVKARTHVMAAIMALDRNVQNELLARSMLGAVDEALRDALKYLREQST